MIDDVVGTDSAALFDNGTTQILGGERRCVRAGSLGLVLVLGLGLGSTYVANMAIGEFIQIWMKKMRWDMWAIMRDGGPFSLPLVEGKAPRQFHVPTIF